MEGHVIYKLRNAPVNYWPFPHFQVINVFPPEQYHSLVWNLTHDTVFEGEDNGRYHGRTFAKKVRAPELKFMQTDEFMRQVCSIFDGHMREHCKRVKSGEIYSDLRLIRDCEGYQIGPHTDAKWKLISLLFYLPESYNYGNFGTSIYVPKNRGYTCEGGPHHKFDGFDEVSRANFVPNSCFGFWKTNNSFHGVEPITKDFNRDVLLYNVYCKKTYDMYHKE